MQNGLLFWYSFGYCKDTRKQVKFSSRIFDDSYVKLYYDDKDRKFLSQGCEKNVREILSDKMFAIYT